MAKKHNSSQVQISSPKKQRYSLRNITVTPAKNGGHVVEHSYDGGDGMSYKKPDSYAFGSSKEALDHLAKHLGNAVEDDEAALKGKK